VAPLTGHVNTATTDTDMQRVSMTSVTIHHPLTQTSDIASGPVDAPHIANTGLPIGRRTFMTGALAAALLAACGLPPLPDGLPDTAVPTKEEMFGWIQQIVAQGIRRPAYPADVWTEQFVLDTFTAFGLEQVRFEPITVRRWQTNGAQLVVTPNGGDPVALDAFPAPYSAPVTDLDVDLARYQQASPADVAGKAALYDVTLLGLPATFLVPFGSAPPDTTGRIVDPEGTFAGETHLLPFGIELDKVMEPAIGAGAAAFIGNLTNCPGGSKQYFVPYDGVDRPIPGVWISGPDATWLRQQLALGPVAVRLTVDATVDEVESHNVVGELPGHDDETVIIGSHHDGPWASAVEDASGVALVLAQARFWAAQPVDKRPHRLLFLLHGGHMSGGAGLHQYIEAHRPELASVVLETHLEHAARQCEERDGQIVPTGRCEPRWWFTSRNPRLETIVTSALTTEKVHRSMLLAPDAIGAQPPTDGAFYHTEGVPIVQHLAAPWYLFDEADTLDNVDQDGLVALTRATIRIVNATRNITAAAMRAGIVT
jgi:hypothetical protein